MIKVIAFQRESHVAKDVLSLSVSARIIEALKYLEDNGLISYATITEKDPRSIQAVEWADVVIFSKHNSCEAIDIARYAKKRDVLIIYDIDDWVFDFPTYSGAQKINGKIDQIQKMIALSDTITVANKTLKRKMQTICNQVVLVPNGIYVEKYTNGDCINEERDNYPRRIVFTNADFLKLNKAKNMLMRALQEFFHFYPDYVLDFYGDPFPEMRSLPFLHFTNRMQYQDYMIALISGGYHFAITPLGGYEDEDSLFFNSCKNPFKYLNYGASGIPGIYSRTPIYENCVTQFKTGLLSDNTYVDWVDALATMANDQRLRNQIRKNAYEDIIDNFHIKYSAKVLESIINGDQMNEDVSICSKNMVHHCHV